MLLQKSRNTCTAEQEKLTENTALFVIVHVHIACMNRVIVSRTDFVLQFVDLGLHFVQAGAATLQRCLHIIQTRLGGGKDGATG